MTQDTLEREDINIGDIIEDAVNEGGDNYHTILEVWKSVLSSGQKVRDERITPPWAQRICSKNPQLSFADMPMFRDLFYDRIAEFEVIVAAEIDTDSECLNMQSAEEDKENNAHHYVNIVVNWQKALAVWEMSWDCEAPDAAVDLAAMAEVQQMIFSETGVVSLLDQIKLEFTEADAEYLAEQLKELRGDE